MVDRFSADPTVVFMTAVLDDIAEGKLLIPRFQRPLVWNWEQRRDLFSSLYEGLPVGALMLWVSDGEPISTYDSLGPHPLPQVPPGTQSRYLMDGVQRVSTLYGALRAKGSWEEYDVAAGVEVQDFVVYADLDAIREQDRFVRRIDIGDAEIEADPTRYMALSLILDSREILKFQRTIPPEQELRIDAADSIATAFREYKLPLITLKSASLEVVTKSFQRVNSRGADMSELHMLNALSYSSSFDLLKNDQDLREQRLTPLGWGRVDQEVVLRGLKLRLGADIYSTNPDEISDQLKRNPVVLEEVFQGLEHCAEFLSNQLSIHRPELVPYRMQVVGLAWVLIDRDWRMLSEQLTDWFWISTYTEAFGSSARQSENALGDLANFIQSGTFEWSLRERPTVRSLNDLRVDFRAARVKALALALARRRASFYRGSTQPWFGPENFPQVVFDRALRGRPGFRFYIEQQDSAALRAALLDHTLSAEDQASHLISDEAAAFAQAGQWLAFVRAREDEIFSYEKSQIIAPAATRMGLPLIDPNFPGASVLPELSAEY
jgi:hypothetical protein